MSCPHVGTQPQKLCIQVCFQRLNAWRHITQEPVRPRVQNPSHLSQYHRDYDLVLSGDTMKVHPQSHSFHSVTR